MKLNAEELGLERTGTWEESLVTQLTPAAHTVSRWMGSAVNWVMDNQSVVLLFIGWTLLLCGIALGVRYCWRRWLKKPVRKAWNKLVRNPIHWLLRPIYRAHGRWSRKNLRAKMAKWKEEVVASILYDGLTKACDDGIINKHVKRRLIKDLAVFLNLKDLKKPNYHPAATKRKMEMLKVVMKERRGKIAGPKGPLGGEHTGQVYIPEYQGLGHKFLGRRKVS